jgi:hypothetical protein
VARRAQPLSFGPGRKAASYLCLDQVSSMKISRRGSTPAARDVIVGADARHCQAPVQVRAAPFFFEAPPFAARQQPHQVVRHMDAARSQLSLQAMQRQKRRPIDPLQRTRGAAPEFACAAPHLGRRDGAGRPAALQLTTPLMRPRRGNGHHRPTGLTAQSRSSDRLTKSAKFCVLIVLAELTPAVPDNCTRK